LLLLVAIPLGFVCCVFSPLLGRSAYSLFIPVVLGFLPVAALVVLGSRVSISRILLQTSGGPVLLVEKVQLSEPSGTLARFEAIKDAIEQAMREGKG
jgi:hypothetical protein